MSELEPIFANPLFTTFGPTGYVLILTAWGLSVGVVVIHAASNKRRPWLWAAIAACLPFAGVVIYYCYFRLRAVHERKHRADLHKSRAGDYLLNPRNVDDKLKMDAISVLANYRDRQIEQLIGLKKMDDALHLIEKRIGELSAKGDKTAIETLHYYKGVIGRYEGTKELPKYFSELLERSGALDQTVSDETVMLVDDTGDWVKEFIVEESEEPRETKKPPNDDEEQSPETDTTPPRWLEI